MDTTFEPKIVAFVCNWCTYTGADLAGTSRVQYASNVRIVKLPCTGRISPLFVIRALMQGADGVLVSGCHPGDCHYTAGNYHARRKYTVLRELLHFLGIEPERVQFSWVSAAEGRKWAEVVNDVVAGVRALGPRGGENGGVGEWESGRAAAAAGTNTPTLQHSNTPAQTELRAKARALLEQGDVSVVIGYGEGTLPGATRPVFITAPADADRLVWNEHCRNNLSVYLTKENIRKLGKAAVVVKGCDTKSVVGLVQENQVKREDVVLLGMACGGVQSGAGIAAKCPACDVHTPPIVDHVIGEAPANPEPMDPRVAELERLAALPAPERRAYWESQFERCLRCYACRAACPLCYCERCLADKTQPRWIPAPADTAGNVSWHAVRALHLAGRCADCGACTQACPANIRLDLLNLRMAQVVEEAFGYQSGRDLAAAPPLTVFREDDKQEFVR